MDVKLDAPVLVSEVNFAVPEHEMRTISFTWHSAPLLALFLAAPGVFAADKPNILFVC